MVVLAVVVFGYTLDYGQHSEALFRVQHRSLWWNLDAPSGEQAVTLPWTCLNVSKFFVSFGTPTSCNRDLHALNDVIVCKPFNLPSSVKRA